MIWPDERLKLKGPRVNRDQMLMRRPFFVDATASFYSYVKYINTRDFSDTVSGDVAPEGMAFAGAARNPSGNHILLAAAGIADTVSINLA